jgi:AcrR family transcriptional regulator
MVSKSTAEVKRTARAARRREQTCDEILDATRAIILRDGVDGFAIASVADELGLTKPALYYYFDSKEALILEFLLREWVEAAQEVEAAVALTENGADAVEVLMRTLFERYRNRLPLFMFCYRLAPSGDLTVKVGPGELERVRPVNDMLYKGAEKRLRADQRAGRFPKKRNARRFVFCAHTAVVGLLNMMAMVSTVGDPLIHKDDDLINEICQTYRVATNNQGAK